MVQNPGITKSDILKIIVDTEYDDCEFVDLSTGDDYQQAIRALAQQIPIDIRYAILCNCHGLYVSTDGTDGYLVSDSDGTEQTGNAFAFAIGEYNNSNIILCLTNTDWIMTSTNHLVVYKKEFNTIPNTSYEFGDIEVGDNRPVKGNDVREALDETTKEISEIAEGRRTVYVFDDTEDLDEWLLNPTAQDGSWSPVTLLTGDVFLIRDTTEPDYWWDANVTPPTKRQLETRSFVLPEPNWNETTITSPNYIKNKPSIPSTASWSVVTSHVDNSNIHVTANQKSEWDKDIVYVDGTPSSDYSTITLTKTGQQVNDLIESGKNVMIRMYGGEGVYIYLRCILGFESPTFYTFANFGNTIKLAIGQIDKSSTTIYPQYLDVINPANTVTGVNTAYKIQAVSALPASPNADTLYLVTG